MVTPHTIPEKELDLLAYWESDKTFEKSLEQTKNKPEYVFYDGPPFATGLPHHGHLLASVAKDLVPRFWTMKGRHVKRRWGWDCHGLPIETIVEKNLGLKSKGEIDTMGVEAFNAACRSSVMRYASEWGKTIRRIARWVEFENSYKTMDTSYIESVWWAFKQLYDKEYIYKGEKILMYCPRCMTPLAKSEISMDNSYKLVKDLSVAVKFKLTDEDAFAIAWTTTPWTLPSNLALAVHPDMDYSYIKDLHDGSTYLLAKELIGKFYKNEADYEIIRTVKGVNLKGKRYEPLFDYFATQENAFQIVLADFITSEEGTGIVHTAPAFGEDDYEVCKKNKIGMVQPVDEAGRFTSEITDFAGRYVHDVNEDIVIFLKKAGKVVYSQKITHDYPFCCRCDTKLLYRALPAWFVNVQKIKPRLLELNTGITWHPDFVKEGRFQHVVETAPDWNISRNRYWATAIPIWESEAGERLVIGSVEELRKYAISLPSQEVDLHKDYLDKGLLEKDGVRYRRVPEVLDCWFESGSMPFAQFHYPFENKEHFETHLPAQYVVEYIGQTRTWFYYMTVLSAILFDKIPFENVHVTGNILAEDGSKMSKSKGNFTDPNKIVEQYGADTLRFYLMSSSFMNAQDGNFMDKGVEEVYKKILLLLYNVSQFYDDYGRVAASSEESNHVLDKWILSRTKSLVETVETNLASYNTVKACAAIREYIDELSNWYIRNSRVRFSLGDGEAKRTLREVLDVLARVIAPIMPFVAEHLYRVIGNGISVHLSSWPDAALLSFEGVIEREMSFAREVTSMALRKRDQERVNLRWPLRSIRVMGEVDLRQEIRAIVLEEVNVKHFEYSKGEQTAVELDTTLTFELESEGYSREIIRFIQAVRKKMGLVRTDRVHLKVYSEFNEYLRPHEQFIRERVGALESCISDAPLKDGVIEEGTVKGKRFLISLNKN